MATYREALFHARAGGTSRSAARVLRFLTFEEASPILLERSPTRAVRRDERGKAVVANGKLVIDEIADSNYPLKKLGLFDIVSMQPFAPTPEDLEAEWVREGVDDVAPPEPEPEPEPVPPEAVDEMLIEEEPAVD